MVWHTPAGVRAHSETRYRIHYRIPIVYGGMEAGSNVGGAESDLEDEEGPRNGSIEAAWGNEYQVALGRARLRWLSTYLVLKRGLQAEPLALGEATDADAHFRCFARELVLLLRQRG